MPFAATEALCTDVDHIKNSIFSDNHAILEKLFTFITGNNFVQGGTTINHTLGGYFNKIVSFWLIKEPQRMLDFVMSQRQIISSMFETHLFGLSSCVTDLIVRFCTVRDIQGLNP
jgi:hypothetical protein